MRANRTLSAELVLSQVKGRMSKTSWGPLAPPWVQISRVLDEALRTEGAYDIPRLAGSAECLQ